METIKKLIIKRLREALTPAEEQTLQDWMKESARNRMIVEEVSDPDRLAESFAKLDNLHPDQVWERLKAFSEERRAHAVPDIVSVHLLKTAWLRYAAAVILLFGAGAYIWLRQEKKVPVQIVNAIVPQDVPAPSSNRATVTLADGRQIFIDSIADGVLAVQGNVQIRKTDNGCIEYRYTGSGKKEKIQYNTLTVPRGSQIASVVLSDGSKVFLNAASSLTYPVAFAGNERRAKITGEAYFEVAKDPSRKFIVIGGGMTTEVLGTHFNINTYPDETVMDVTLLEGRVKVSDGASDLIIQPGEQAAYSEGIMQVNPSVNTDAVMAWKNGLFNFQDKHLPEVMRQLARWYDLQVIYEKKIPEIEYFGQMGRNLKLSDVLEVLKSTGVHFRLEKGRRLFIM